MRVGSLFSGIGGLDLGLERAGMSVVWQCELDPYCRAVLRKHWPDVPCYEDVRDITADAPTVDLICGGFPCQPVSKAGKRKAQADDRWLWPEFARLIRDLRPRYALLENVTGLLTTNGGLAMGEVLGDLAALGYDAEWDCIPAASVGAPHLRDRVFVVAYPYADSLRRDEGRKTLPFLCAGQPEPRHQPRELRRDVAYAGQEHGRSRVVNGGASASSGPTDQPHRPLAESGRRELATWWEAEPDVGRVAYGVPAGVDRLGALGNAVVPQVAEWIGHRIMTADDIQEKEQG